VGLALADLHDDLQSCDRRNRAGKVEIAAERELLAGGNPRDSRGRRTDELVVRPDEVDECLHLDGILVW
jgi:hypothetical protein